MPVNSTNQVLKKIKQKKELAGVADSVVKEILANYVKKYKISLADTSPSQIKILVKEIRAILRNYTGQFQKSMKDRGRLLSSPVELLKTHSSTSERKEFYPKLRSKIQKLNPNSILDVGCGLNPIALASPGVKYFASDIREDELKIIKDFFKLNKIDGETFVQDLRKENLKLPKSDLCLLFKVLDTIEKNHAERILESIDCKWVLVSFSTKKLSGKKMTSPKRKWFEKILERLSLGFEEFESDNEIFYLIKK